MGHIKKRQKKLQKMKEKKRQKKLSNKKKQQKIITKRDPLLKKTNKRKNESPKTAKIGCFRKKSQN